MREDASDIPVLGNRVESGEVMFVRDGFGIRLYYDNNTRAIIDSLWYPSHSREIPDRAIIVIGRSHVRSFDVVILTSVGLVDVSEACLLAVCDKVS